MTCIALISDIHFGKFSRTAEFSVPGEEIEDDNTGAKSLKSSMISLLKDKNIEYLCISGDITSQGSPQEFAHCEQMVLNVAKELHIPVSNVIMVLGNHDIDWKISDLYKHFEIGNPNFPQTLVKEKYRKIAASVALTNFDVLVPPTIKGPAPFSGIVENENFVMFVLNTGWCCTQEQSLSHGKLDDLQLEWFERKASEYKNAEKWKIVLMHHHPFNYSYPINTEDYSSLEEGSKFLDIAGQNGFHLVMHGHRHHPQAQTTQKNGWPHPITFICAGSFSVNAAHRSSGLIPNTLHVLELSDEVGVLTLHNYQYSPYSGWSPFTNNNPATPIDSQMLLGKLFTADQINTSLKQLAETSGRIHWSELDECLRFMPYDKLNSSIKESLKDTHDMAGHFPDDIVYLIKR